MKSKRLSAIDAFFIAYQETSGVLMQLGVETELKGPVSRKDVAKMLSHLVRRWPPLGQRASRRFFGLAWEGEPRVRAMLQIGGEVSAWRNKPLNPFIEPPFQVLWIANGDENMLAFRAHHAVVDGEGFFGVCAEALRALAGKEQFATDQTDKNHGFTKRISVADALGTVQKLREEAKS